MRDFRLFSLMIALTAVARVHAIDLTPTVTEYTAEGITFRQLNFKDGKRQVVYEPPRQWTCRGGGSSLQLTPPNSNRADALIQVVETKPSPNFDEKTVAALKEQFMRTLPPESQSVRVIHEEQNPVRLENSESYAVTGSYKVMGETFVRSLLFVHLSDAQLTFKLTARKADFDSFQKVFRSSVLSWHWVDASATAAALQKAPSQTAVSRQE